MKEYITFLPGSMKAKTPKKNVNHIFFLSFDRKRVEICILHYQFCDLHLQNWDFPRVKSCDTFQPGM